ncbi:conjugal transfer protein TraI [Amycolatopsis cynarae]|uniref:Conjugal transfer protein TraI n=1 Tax=Amycolatopsis cynarae TaxID=2995223 RepID=A0ABY7B458_9PSEU|nr:conjugal transfer protein TraI [Amycolatopsis sp. HUAS 11-8]WAL65603.1 conjugal transfer protein TraI [Amycolatopsis sp. HUAS 11-8]
MSTTTPFPEPTPDEVQRGLTELEQHLATHAPTDPGSARVVEPVQGETKRVATLRAEVAEAHRLLALQDDEAPLLVESPKVRRRRKQGQQAARLHALAQSPALLAWQAARWRLVLTVAAFVALTLALGWSTAGVQVFAAEGAPAWSPSWCFAWLVEPFLSLALLTVVAARAFLATRGRPLDHPTLRKIEALFLGLTLGMNAWPHLPWTAPHFTVSGLVLHLLGPVVAVAVVTALPIIWRAFAELDHARPAGAGEGVTPLTYRANTPTAPAAATGAARALVERARELIRAGRLPTEPSANKVRAALGCGMDDARHVRDALRGAA